MAKKIVFLLLFQSIICACQPGGKSLPPITDGDIRRTEVIEETLQKEIASGELIRALEDKSDINQKGFLVNGIIEKLIKLILPKHLENFDSNHKGLSEKDKTFAEYKGVYGRCHQFRVFYKYQDSRIKNVVWASSLLSIPQRDKKNINAGVVLAPTLDGFSPFIESGLWLKLCRRGIATLMPESIYRRNNKQWEKLLFDPTPPYHSVDEYSLYENSIKRYEKLLQKNIGILRNFQSLENEDNQPLQDLGVMPVRPQRVGFWGSSFGAIVGSLIVAKDPEIKAAVLTAAGGDLAYVVAHSKISLFKKTRAAQMKLLGLQSLNEYQEFISKHIESDPLFFAQENDGQRLFMIMAKKDKSVPTKVQYDLFEKFGRPQNSRIYGGHVPTLLFMSWFDSHSSRRAIDSLIENFEKESEKN